jgi:ketosteroid isomerase-like protein
MDRLQLARDSYAAFAAGDRARMEALLADDFTFSAPPDPLLDRAAYWERCFANGGDGTAFDFVRLFEDGDEVVVTYEATRPDGTRFRNCEVLIFAGDRISRVEVYFGWNLDRLSR